VCSSDLAATMLWHTDQTPIHLLLPPAFGKIHLICVSLRQAFMKLFLQFVGQMLKRLITLDHVSTVSLPRFDGHWHKGV
jgi:hypothetical protein